MDNAELEAKYMISQDYDKGDGEDILKDIREIKDDYARIKVNSRHLKIGN